MPHPNDLPDRDWDQQPKTTQRHLHQQRLTDSYSIEAFRGRVGIGTGSTRDQRRWAGRLALALILAFREDGDEQEVERAMIRSKHWGFLEALRYADYLCHWTGDSGVKEEPIKADAR